MCSGAIEILGRRSRMKQTKLDAGETLEEVLSAGAQRKNNCLLLRQKIACAQTKLNSG